MTDEKTREKVDRLKRLRTGIVGRALRIPPDEWEIIVDMYEERVGMGSATTVDLRAIATCTREIKRMLA